MEIRRLFWSFLVLICIYIPGSLSFASENILSLKLKSTPPADESYSQRFIKSYQQCEEVFIANKKANKKLVQNYFSTPQNIDIIINVKKSGVIANVNIPLNTNSDFQYKKWMACLTKKTFQFQFPTLPKNIRYHLVLEAKINP